VWAAGSAQNTTWLVVLANIGFLLNAFNLLPIGFLDGGTVFRSISMSRRGWIRYENGIPVEAVPPDPEHANLITVLYVLLAAALVGGLLATRHSGML
jgi:Zn-dependent protease